MTVDVNTFVAPALECVYNDSSEALRSHWPEIEQHLALTRPAPGVGDWPESWLRIDEAGGASPAPFPPATPGAPEPEPGVLHENAAGRLRAMDRLGATVHVVSPLLRLDVDEGIGSHVSRMLFDAYNRYALRYCSAAPERLRAVVQLHGHEPHWSADQLDEMAQDDCVAAFSLRLLPRIAPDSPHFAPIWRAIERTGLPLLHRPSEGTVWWTPRRMLSYLAQTGILDAQPQLKLIFVGWPAGWIADWLEADDSLLARYAGEGRVFAGLDPAETPQDVRRIVGAGGDRWLLWQSGFPFGPGADGALAALPEAARERVLTDNAAACLQR